MVALQYLGLGAGIASAAIISGYTYFAWNHPWAIVTMTAEVAVVGWLVSRRKLNLVVADALYWIFVGIPIGYICFHILSDFSISNTLFLMTKQAINGITNALIARLIYYVYTIFSFNFSRISFREIVSNLMILFVICPFLILMAVSGKTDMVETDRQIRIILSKESQAVTSSLNEWFADRERLIAHLAKMAAKITPSQMQPHLEQIRNADINFLEIALLDSKANIAAKSPLFDDSGQNNIGKKFADHPYIPTIRQSLKPMLSELFTARIGDPKPMAAVLAPIVTNGQYRGYVSGILSLDRIKNILEINTSGREISYTLLDKNDNIIVTSRKEQKTTMSPSRSKGSFKSIEEGLWQWVPKLPANASTIDLWGKSYYIAESTIGGPAGWKLVLEKPVAPFQNRLYGSYTNKLFLLYAILLAALAIAEFLSRKVVSPIQKLAEITHELPAKLSSENQIPWPESVMLEINNLISNSREMADSLTAKFIENRQIKEFLEHRVEKRTEELRKSEEFLNNIVENIPIMVFMKDAIDLKFVKFNKAGEELLGYKREELLGKNDYDFFPKKQADFFTYKDRQVILRGHPIEIPEESIKTRYLGERILHTRKITIFDKHGNPEYLLGISEDISERKQVEEKILQLNRELEQKVAERTNELRDSQLALLNLVEDLNDNLKKLDAAKHNLEIANKELEAFSYSVSHDLKAPLRAISGFAQIIARRHYNSLNEEASHYFDNIISASEKMSILINELLEYSRIGRVAVRLQPVSINDVVSQVLDILSERIKQSGTNLALSEALPVVNGNANLLRQILTNLLENAIVFRKKDTPSKIEISFREEDSYVILIVADNGIGIQREYHEKIFNMFQRLHTEDEYPGTGIGLAIVKKAVNLMNGSIWIESTPGKGSVFYVKLEKG